MFEEKNKNYAAFVYSNKTELKYGLLFGLVLFLTPFISSNQLIVGTIVNALLIKAAVDFKSKKAFLLSIVPSIAAFSAGFLFGGLTHQVILMLPFIWAGNLALMIILRKMFVKQRKSFLYSSLAAGTAKTALLFLAALALFTLSLAPAVVLTAFGIMQFVTAQAGGIIVLLSNKILKLRN